MKLVFLVAVWCEICSGDKKSEGLLLRFGGTPSSRRNGT